MDKTFTSIANYVHSENRVPLKPDRYRTLYRVAPLSYEDTPVTKFLHSCFEKGTSVPPLYPRNYVSQVISSYIRQKYKIPCYLGEVVARKSYYADNMKFVEYVVACAEPSPNAKISLVPLFLEGHMNMLFIDFTQFTITRFEPHGSVTSKKDDDLVKFLRHLTDQINSALKGEKKFKFCTNDSIIKDTERILFDDQEYTSSALGIQELEGLQNLKKKGEVGYCKMWCWLFGECVLQSPGRSLNETYKEFLGFLQSGEKFLQTIRGYYYFLEEAIGKEKWENAQHGELPPP